MTIEGVFGIILERFRQGAQKYATDAKKKVEKTQKKFLTKGESCGILNKLTAAAESALYLVN